MRKITLLSILLALTMVLFAKHVPMETAQSVAKTFWEQNVQKGNIFKAGNVFNDISDQTEFTNLYIFNTNGGFVIVSADDAAKPILGYSQQGSFDPNNIPVNARAWLKGYNSEIQYAIDNNIEAGAETRNAWNNLRNGNGLAPKSTRAISQMLTTTWNQAPYYNNLCPYDEQADGRSVTGCVATAMAQVMKYWNWPVRGTGSHSYTSDEHPEYGTMSANFGNTTYDWDNMPNALSSSSSSTEINAVATLMYHCGVAVEMNYSATGSGAYTISYDGYFEYCAESAFRNFFGYNSDLYGLYRTTRYIDNGDTLTYEAYPYSEWVSMLKDELDVYRPILYAGAGPDGGHAFVFDGYDNNDLFHINWGWGSWEDGYFSIDALEPAAGGIGGGSYQFNIDQKAIFGVEPAYTNLTLSTNSLIIDPNGGSATFTVRASNNNSQCYLYTDASWLTLSRTTANGNSASTTITVTAQSLSSGNRSATITVTQGNQTANLTVSQRATYQGGPFWQCTFEEATPLYTTGQVSSSIANWEQREISYSSGGNYYYNLNYHVENEEDVTHSATPQHWMIIDGDGSTRNGYDFDSYMLFTGIDLSAAENPQISFYEYRRLHNIPPTTEATVVEVSLNGGATWTTHIVGCESQAESNFAYRRVPIFEARGYSNVMIRFRAKRSESIISSYFNGNPTYSQASFVVLWEVDDITIEDAQPFDLVITDARMNDGYCDYYSNPDFIQSGYSSVHYQLHPMFGQTPRSEWTSYNKFASFNVAVENRGSEYVTPIVHIAVADPNGNEIWNVDFEGEPVGPYGRDTIDVIEYVDGNSLDKVFFFTEEQMQNIVTGRYLVTYSVSTESGDDPTPANNTTSHPFYITEEAYSPATPNITRTTGPNTWSNFTDGDEILAYFTYYVLPNGEIPVYVYISENTTPGTEIVAKIYDNNLNLTNSSNRYTITESDLGQWVNIPLTTPLYISEFDENSTYKNVKVGIAFYENGEDNDLYIGASNDMPNKGWICSYKMSGSTTSFNVTSESVAPAICLGNPNPETITTYTIDVLSANDAMGSASGSGTYNYGEQITILATANNGYRFTQWQDGSTANPRTITVTENATYIASFEEIPVQYTITVLSANESMGSASGSGTYNYGAQVTISATANSGYRFTQWQDGSTANPRIITVTENANYIASFEEIPVQYTITVLSANETMGSATGGGIYNYGSQVTISATANSGYRFSQWQDGSTANPRTITVTENANYIATFEAIPATTYTITVEIEGAYFVDDVLITYNGEIVTAPVTVEHGATPSFVIDGQMTTNGDYFNIVSIAVDGEEVELLNENFINIYTYNYTFEPVTANHTLLITFSRISSADLLDDSSMAIYPNPNNGMFSIDFSNIEGDATYQIINANGAVVETRDINVTNGENKMFNHNLSAGTYFIRIINGDKVYIEQIVVE
ncbi:MAG: C10 family peptidase [Bacteroidales bacterium]|nr:C10 family peptidase [Bacteroidales bacterium]